jgi:dihydrofolate synthase/folylpolyglutamate synthase
VLARLEALHPKKIDLSLGRIQRLLRALGNPERNLPPIIHIAGTNGKGSVVAFIKAMAAAAGLKTNIYTSPHLVRFTERIEPAGREISDRALALLLEECEVANGAQPITFFEITTAAAFLAFSREKADLTLLETGLGGRLDATNAITRSAVTVITPVSLDHQQFLGSRLATIAGEKAGIMKRCTPAIIGPQHAIAARVINERATALKAPLIRWGQDFKAEMEDESLIFRHRDGDLHLPLPSLAGTHQATNSAIAIAALKALKDPDIGTTAFAQGIAHAKWPARLQRLTGGPLSAPLTAAGFEVWLDGGHNPAAGRALAKTLIADSASPLYLVVGMVADKHPGAFLKPLATLAPKGLWAVAVPGNHVSFPSDRLAAIAQRLGITTHRVASPAAALGAIAQRPPGRVLITGSLYLAGAVLSEDRDF